MTFTQIQINSLESNISSLKSQLDREQYLLSEYSKIRCIFRQHKEICVTVANQVDIDKSIKKVESLTNQLSNAKISLEKALNPEEIIPVNESNVESPTPENYIPEIQTVSTPDAPKKNQLALLALAGVFLL